MYGQRVFVCVCVCSTWLCWSSVMWSNGGFFDAQRTTLYVTVTVPDVWPWWRSLHDQQRDSAMMYCVRDVTLELAPSSLLTQEEGRGWLTTVYYILQTAWYFFVFNPSGLPSLQWLPIPPPDITGIKYDSNRYMFYEPCLYVLWNSSPGIRAAWKRWWLSLIRNKEIHLFGLCATLYMYCKCRALVVSII